MNEITEQLIAEIHELNLPTLPAACAIDDLRMALAEARKLFAWADDTLPLEHAKAASDADQWIQAIRTLSTLQAAGESRNRHLFDPTFQRLLVVQGGAEAEVS